jgi:hypothetical protein
MPHLAALAQAEMPHLAALGLSLTMDDLVAPFSLGDADELGGLLEGAGFGSVDIVPASIVARFPEPERFVERLEYAYAAVIPAFLDDPDVFAGYLEAIEQDTREIVQQHLDGDHVAVPMHTHLALAQA